MHMVYVHVCNCMHICVCECMYTTGNGAGWAVCKIFGSPSWDRLAARMATHSENKQVEANQYC